MPDTFTFVPPSWLESQDAETIHRRMMGNLPADIDDTEGGFPWDFTKPTALEKAEMLQYEVMETLKTMHYMFAYGIYLDYHAEAYTLRRRGSVAASGDLTIHGSPGTVIPKGFLFAVPAKGSSSAITFAANEEVTLDYNGDATVSVTCTEYGTIGNVAADTIVIMVSPITGIKSITNEEEQTGGAAEEDDETLRERIREYLKTVNVSFAGCDSDYKRWSLELDSVGSVVVIPEWNGPGTVKVVVLDRNSVPANEIILAEVYDHIVSPDDRDKRLAPIGATVSVVAPTTKNISVSCDITLESGAVLADIESEIAASITEYIRSGTNIVRLAKIGSIILGTDGVADYDDLTLNGDTENIPVAKDEYPMLYALTLDDGEE